MRNYLVSTAGAVIIGSLIISFSILLHGGIIKIRGIGTYRGSTSTTTTPTSPTASLSEKLVEVAKSEAGLDEGNFKACLESQKYKSEMDKDQADAQAAGIQGTPGFIVGKSTGDGKITGIRIAGAYPYQIFKGVIDELNKNTALDQIPTIVTKAAYPDSSEEELKQIKDGLVPNSSASVDDDPVLGQANAPVTIIEFSDYECPFCKRHFQQTFPSIKSDYIDSGKAKLVFRDYVAVPSHNPAATTEALAASCAKELGGDEAYYKLHDIIFTKTQANGAAF